jgi:hypothetical protein
LPTFVDHLNPKKITDRMLESNNYRPSILRDIMVCSFLRVTNRLTKSDILSKFLLALSRLNCVLLILLLTVNIFIYFMLYRELQNFPGEIKAVFHCFQTVEYIFIFTVFSHRTSEWERLENGLKFGYMTSWRHVINKRFWCHFMQLFCQIHTNCALKA